MPSFVARPPWPWVFSEKESTSETARFHCECPLQICAVCWLPGAEATCIHPLLVQNIILAKQLWVAQRVCMPMYTQQLVAASLSGLRRMPGGKMKSIGANVELQIGRSWKKYSYMKLARCPTTACVCTLYDEGFSGEVPVKSKVRRSPRLVSVRKQARTSDGLQPIASLNTTLRKVPSGRDFTF